MTKPEKLNSRRSAVRHAVVGGAILAVTAAVVVSMLTADNPVSASAPAPSATSASTVGAAPTEQATPAAAPGTPAADPTPAGASSPEADSAAANWMEALIPQVDPHGEANWVFKRNGGWGASDGHTNYIDPNVPSDKRFSVMVHELGHVKQVEVYGSLRASVAAMNAVIGSSSADVSTNEKAADCMAVMLGASWIDYGCPDSLRGAAAAVLAGHRA